MKSLSSFVLKLCYSVAMLCCFSVILSLSKATYAFNLPDTGQTSCYDYIGNLITCPVPENPLAQDGSYNLHPLSYTNNSVGIVTDNNTSLMWQQQDDGIAYNWYQATGTVDSTYNPSDGTYKNVCASLTLGSHLDWRLPSRKELIGIVDYSIPDPGPPINPIFTNTQQNGYWSSTTYAAGTGSAWTMTFTNGYGGALGKAGSAYVRCVRGGQQSFRFTDNADGSVTDVRTGLIWQQRDDGAGKWPEMLAYCEGLPLANQTDWRLPNIKELESMTDDSRSGPALDPVFVVNGGEAWSSTTYAKSTDAAWYENYGAGLITYESKPVYRNARCVRGGSSGSGNLTISKSGAGTGTVVSNPAGINCGISCSTYATPFPLNQVVTISATPSTGGSIFSGWGWSPDSDCSDGIVTLSTDKSCMATFGLCDSASIARTGSSALFGSINAAYTGAASTDTIKVVASNQQEALVFGSKHITLQGGYDCAFTEPAIYFTTITDSLTISGGGSVNIGWIRIQ